MLYYVVSKDFIYTCSYMLPCKYCAACEKNNDDGCYIDHELHSMFTCTQRNL